MEAARKKVNKGPDKRQLSDEKREAIRQTIINLFADALYQDVGIRDICTQAGVTPKTIYKHFGNKDALLISAISPDLKRLNLALSVASQIGPTLIDSLQAISQAFFRFYFENVAIARIMFLNIPSAYLVSKPEYIQSVQLGILRDLIIQGQKTEVIRQDVDASELTEAVAGLTMRSMFRYLTASTPLPTPKEAADKISLLSTPMLLNPSSGKTQRLAQ